MKLAQNVAFERPALSPENRLAMCLAPIAGLVYPLTLTAFKTAVKALETGHEPEIAALVAANASVTRYWGRR